MTAIAGVSLKNVKIVNKTRLVLIERLLEGYNILRNLGPTSKVWQIFLI